MGLLNSRRGAALPSFASELPHGFPVDVDTGTVLLQTRRSPKLRLALGCAWETLPVNIECLDEDECKTLARHHEQLIRGLPVGACLQTLMTMTPSTTFPAWEAQRAELSPSQALTVQRAAIATGLPHSTGPVTARLRAIHHLVTLRCPLSTVRPTLPTLLKTLGARSNVAPQAFQAQLRAQIAQDYSSFRGLRALVEHTLRSLGHTVTALTFEGLGQAIARALDPLGIQDVPLILPEYTLGSQVLRGEAETCPGGWRFGTTDAATGALVEAYRQQVLSLQRIPYQTYPGMLSAPRAPKGSKPMALWDAWEQPITVAVNAAVVDPAAEEARLMQKRLIAAFQERISAKNKTIKDQLDKLSEEHLLTGSQTGWGRVHFVVCSQEADGTRGVDAMHHAAGSLRMALSPEPTLGSTLLLQTLPLGFDDGYPPEWALSRARRMPTLETLSHLLTVFGGTHGTRHASIPYVNQRGEGRGFFPFDNPLNPHFNIVGTSGSGKTHEVGRILGSILPLGAMVVILDPLKNYRTLCEYFEGELVVLTAHAPLCINPFYGPLDDMHISRLAAGLKEMASGGTDRLTWTEFTVLGRALKFFAGYWNPARGEPILEHFAEEVLKTGQFADDNEEARTIGRALALKLSLFYGDGMYAKFVNGPNSFRLNTNLTVVEFGELKNEHLQGILFYFLFNLITLRYEDPALLGTWKCIIGDELWKLLKYKDSADVIEEVIRTYRNIRTSAVFLSQRAEDWNSPVGQVIKGIAETNLFLKQGSGELPLVQKLFDLSAAEMDLFQYVDKYDTFGSAFLRLPEKRGGIVRMIPDPLTTLLMAQTPEMHQKRAHLAAMGTHRPLRERIAESGFLHG